MCLPRYAVEALELSPAVNARIGGQTHRAAIEPDGTLRLEEVTTGALGLGTGDPVDVFLTADL